MAVRTGVDHGDGYLGAASYDGLDVSVSRAAKIDGYFHGSGDVFGSALLAGLVNDLPIAESISLAVDFTRECIRKTVELKQEERYGVCFEKCLHMLRERVGNI